MASDRIAEALADDLNHWIGRVANTRTSSLDHRNARHQLLLLVMQERETILAALRADPAPVAPVRGG